VTSPAGVGPANGAQIANLAQPVTLTIANATTTDSTALVTYTYEVATDSGFTNKVVSQDVPQSPGSQTSLKLNPLAAGQMYVWHVKTTAGASVSPFSGMLSFTIGPAIVIQAPVAASPANGSTTTTNKPTVTFTNSVRTGPAGTITYRVEIATDSGFANIVASATVAEGTNTTSFAPSSPLADKTIYYWHAKATDTNNISSAFSTTASFTTPAVTSPAQKISQQMGTVLWTGKVPTGNYGSATLGDNWDIQILCHVPTGTCFQSPTLEMLRIFDLLDLGYDPDGALAWMNANGYPTNAQWYPASVGKAVIGVQFIYIAARNLNPVHGVWDVILKAE
jgi:hypothetical protein